eukprot:205708_1
MNINMNTFITVSFTKFTFTFTLNSRNNISSSIGNDGKLRISIHYQIYHQKDHQTYHQIYHQYHHQHHQTLHQKMNKINVYLVIKYHHQHHQNINEYLSVTRSTLPPPLPPEITSTSQQHQTTSYPSTPTPIIIKERQLVLLMDEMHHKYLSPSDAPTTAELASDGLRSFPQIHPVTGISDGSITSPLQPTPSNAPTTAGLAAGELRSFPQIHPVTGISDGSITSPLQPTPSNAPTTAGLAAGELRS